MYGVYVYAMLCYAMSKVKRGCVSHAAQAARAEAALVSSCASSARAHSTALRTTQAHAHSHSHAHPTPRAPTAQPGVIKQFWNDDPNIRELDGIFFECGEAIRVIALYELKNWT